VVTYILGAGASKDAGYPLSTELAQALFAWMESTDHSERNYAATATFLKETFRGTSDIEELFTQMQQLVIEYESGDQQQRLIRAEVAEARFTLVQALRELFAEIRTRPAPVYEKFARDIVKDGDKLISFNYDVAPERELATCGKWVLGDGYGFPIEGFSTSSAVQTIKLHGSTNWLALMFGGQRSGTFAIGSGGVFGRRPVLPGDEVQFLGFSGADPLFPNDSPALPVMIMPARAKQFFFRTNLGDEWISFWDWLWERARAALSASSRIVIAGYSMSAADQRARTLIIGDSLRNTEIEIVCGSQTDEIAKLFKEAGYKHVKASEKPIFSEWVEAATAHLI
jgi:hypothetical protein